MNAVPTGLQLQQQRQPGQPGRSFRNMDRGGNPNTPQDAHNQMPVQQKK